MEVIHIKTDQNPLIASVFEPEEIRGLIVLASATGVRQSFYRKFASYLCNHGFAVITFDYSGIGDSLTQPIKQISKGAEDWGRTDLESVLQYGAERYENVPKIVMGHSIGGQIIGLAPSSAQYDAVMLIAAQSGYWKHWSGMGRVKMWFNWHILFPTMLNVFGYLPAKRINGMEDLPLNVAKQWSTWGRHPKYLLGHVELDSTVYHRIKAPLTAFIVEDDDLGPQSASDWLLEQYENSSRTRILLRPSDFDLQRIGHFGVFKERNGENLWPRMVNELNNLIDKS
jgi:predicted alpha/beta hydrolase